MDDARFEDRHGGADESLDDAALVQVAGGSNAELRARIDELKRRLAQGEIDAAQYQEALRGLDGTKERYEAIIGAVVHAETSAVEVLKAAAQGR